MFKLLMDYTKHGMASGDPSPLSARASGPIPPQPALQLFAGIESHAFRLVRSGHDQKTPPPTHGSAENPCCTAASAGAGQEIQHHRVRSKFGFQKIDFVHRAAHRRLLSRIHLVMSNLAQPLPRSHPVHRLLLDVEASRTTADGDQLMGAGPVALQRRHGRLQQVVAGHPCGWLELVVRGIAAKQLV